MRNRLRAFLERMKGRTSQVQVKNYLSSSFSPESGVPQGSNLGPILFVIFINDLPEIDLHGSKCCLYADDLKLYRKVKTKDALSLQKAICSVEEWSRLNCLGLAATKTSLIRLRLGTKVHAFDYIIGQQLIPIVSQIRDLGITIDETLSFAPHIEHLRNQAKRLFSPCFD